MRESTLRFGAQTDEVTSLLRVVNLVRMGEAQTRPQIGTVTGLGRGVVTQRVEQAISMGFLEEGDVGPSSGGRAPRTLRFRGESGLIVVCALGALHIHVGLAQLEGDVIAQAHLDWEISRGPAETLDAALGLVEELLAADTKTRGSELPVWGIAVGVPGPVDFDSGRPVAPPIMPGWNGFDIRRRFEQRFDAPVWVDNDANLLALNERTNRQVPSVDLIYVKVGSGIGAGLVSRGRIHRGANGAAGDIGHVKVFGSTSQCRCGKIGCLEAEAGGWALVRDAQLAIDAGDDGLLARRARAGEELNPELIAMCAEDGDALAIQLAQRSAKIIGESISALVNMFNPKVIVVGGALASAGEIFLAEVRQRVYEHSLPLATRDLNIVVSANDVREPLRGGAAMVREQLFEETFTRWFADGRPTISGLALGR
ncbi:MULTISPECIES: ROK family protein [unclassified Pseudoclavibacter]|uniref:ROK family protein n=1 Tax=unclassified Pseudoclavibacter TaxID=2615177 RepID=UPI0015CE4FA3|nr:MULTISPECIES: ROK family protein [unclassified Pseudoclavibacter]MBS3178747.1 ROK family protein [Pseudoclavibacter sp. Marseille-Q4354]NYF14928.1 putative NBD/HSP70 family sugar kinase [Pseudoclavibacter sp. JAI123]